uniref:hypothetical protein n=1 Tax=Ningiella ruwaisensis TaxID=2364274 RepID=UPI00109EE93B|nr:hypothetical protein [Ningiella ruwaisensis]
MIIDAGAQSTYLAQGNMSDAFQSGLKGYQDASARMQSAASNLAQSNHKNVDLTANALALQSASIQAQASAEVIKRTDTMIGTIIDTYA